MWDTVKSSLKVIAPVIGGALGGPFGAAAASTLSQILLGRSNGTKEEIATATTSMTPEQILRIKEAENNFMLETQRLSNEARKEEIKDVKHAREDRKWFAKMGKVDFMRPFLGISIVAGMFGIIFTIILTNGIPAASKEIIMLVVGYLLKCVSTPFEFYFGSSAGSKRKTELLTK